MKKMAKRMISLSLTALLLFCFTACGSDGSQGGDGTNGGSNTETITEGTEGLVFQSNYNGSECFVSDYTGSETNVVIPTVYKGLPVTGIGEHAFSQIYIEAKIESIYIPNSIRYIGDEAFEGCRKMTEIDIPDSVTTIGEEAFMFCESLTSVKISSSVTSLGRKAFGECVSLKEITIPASVRDVDAECFYHCENLTDIYCEAPMEPSTWSKYWREDMPSTVQVHWDCN